MTGGPLRYAIWCGTIAAATGAAALPLALSRGPSTLQWSLLGWLAMSLVGVLGGAWLVTGHGKQGAAFPLALGVCILSRLAFLVAGFFVAAGGRGMEAAGAYLAGLLVGYLPTQAVEMIWFTRSTRFKVNGDDGSTARAR